MRNDLGKIIKERESFFSFFKKFLKVSNTEYGFDGIYSFIMSLGGCFFEESLTDNDKDTFKSFLKYILGLNLPSDFYCKVVGNRNFGKEEYLLILTDSVYSFIQNLLESTYLTNEKHLNSIVSVIMKCILHNENSNKSSASADELSKKEDDKCKKNSNKESYVKSEMKKKEVEIEENEDNNVKEGNKVKEEEEKRKFVYIDGFDGYFIKDDKDKILIPVKDMIKLSCNFLRYYLKNFTSSFNVKGVGYKCVHIKYPLLKESAYTGNPSLSPTKKELDQCDLLDIFNEYTGNLFPSCGLYGLFRMLYKFFNIMTESSLSSESKYFFKTGIKKDKIRDLCERKDYELKSTKKSEVLKEKGGKEKLTEKSENLKKLVGYNIEKDEPSKLEKKFFTDFFQMPKGLLFKNIKNGDFVSLFKFMLSKFKNFSENLENFLSKDYFKDILDIEKIKLVHKHKSPSEHKYKGAIECKTEKKIDTTPEKGYCSSGK